MEKGLPGPQTLHLGTPLPRRLERVTKHLRVFRAPTSGLRLGTWARPDRVWRVPHTEMPGDAGLGDSGFLSYRFCLDSARQTRQRLSINWSNFSLKKATFAAH